MVKMESVLRRSVDFIGAHLATLLPIAIGGVFLPSTIEQCLEPLHAGAGRPLSALLTLIMVATTLLTIWAQCAIIALAIDPGSGRRAGLIALRRMPAVIVVGLFLLLCIALLTVPIFLLLGSAGFTAALGMTGASVPSAGTMVGVVLYGIALAVVMIVVAARLVVATPVIIAERRWIAAIARSWRLTRGRTLQIVGLAILYIVIVLVSQLAVKTVLGSLLLLALGGGGTITLAGILLAIAIAVLTTIFTVLQAAFVATLYLALADPTELNAAVPA